MKINQEKLTDYLDGLLTLQKREKLVVGTILLDEKNKKNLSEKLKCFGYRLETIKNISSKEQIARLENALFMDSKIAVEFEDEAVALFMTSLKRIIGDANNNQSNNKSAVLLIFNTHQYQQLNNSEIINSICNLI